MTVMKGRWFRRNLVPLCALGLLAPLTVAIETDSVTFTCPVQRLHEISTSRVFEPANDEVGWNSQFSRWCSDTAVEMAFVVPEDVDGVFRLELGGNDAQDRAHFLVDLSPD